MKKSLIIILALLCLPLLLAAQSQLDYKSCLRSAKIYLQQSPKDYKSAVDLLRQAIEKYPNQPPVEAHFLLGAVFADKQQLDSMLKEFDYVSAVCDTVTDKTAQKDCDKSEYAKKIAETKGSKWIEQFNKGVENLKSARSEKERCTALTVDTEKVACDSSAARAYRVALDNFSLSTRILPDSSQGWVNKGLVLYELNETDNALQAYREAARIQADNVPLLSNIATIHFNRQAYDSAAVWFNRLLKLDLDVEGRVSILYNLALCMGQLGLPDSARVLYDEVIKLAPQSSDALFNRGAFFIRKTQELFQRKNALNDSVQIDKKYQKALDAVDAEIKQNLESALADFEKVTQLQPDNVEAWRWVGFCSDQLGELKKAQAAYEKTLELDPAQSDVWCRIAVIYFKLGMKDKSEAANSKCKESE